MFSLIFVQCRYILFDKQNFHICKILTVQIWSTLVYLLKFASYLQPKLLDTCVRIILLHFYQISLTVLLTSPFICFVHIYRRQNLRFSKSEWLTISRPFFFKCIIYLHTHKKAQMQQNITRFYNARDSAAFMETQLEGHFVAKIWHNAPIRKLHLSFLKASTASTHCPPHT